MADNVPKPDPSEVNEDSASSDGDDEGDDSPDNLVESLVAGRAKRVTAGNRLSSLLQHEGGDDELELLFAEDEEEDVEFEGDDVDNASDVQLDSSSDEEDKGPAQVDDDLEGERQLQKQKRVDKKRKRDPQAVFKRPLLRKKLAPPTATSGPPTTPVPRTRKKSERVSWIPTPEEGPTRQSTRKQTVHNKEVIHLRMMESEKRRIQLIGVMEAAAKRRKAPKVITQEERLEEAARTERRNAKSLNRWEESEKKRMEDQKAKMEALQNRQLSGPVICSWSGKARWVNGKVEEVGVKDVQESKKHENPIEDEGHNMDTFEKPAENKPTGSSKDQDMITSQNMQPPSGVLDSGNVSVALYQGPEAQLPPLQPMLQVPNQTPLVEYSARNLVILKNMDANALKMPELHNHVLIRKRIGKIQSKCLLLPPDQRSSDLSLNGQAEPVHDLCAITGQTARYRDPTTGLAYLDSYAYKEIQRLRKGGSRWSSLLGCYVGAVDSFARGVPNRFWKIAEHSDET